VDALVGLLGAAMLCNSLSLSYTAALAGLGRFELQAAADTLLYGLMLGGSVLAMRLGAGIVGIGAAMAAASAAQLGVCWLLGRRVLGPADLRFDPLLARSLLEMAWPLALTGVAIGIYTRIDSVFLSLLHGDRQVGLYDAAYTFIHGLRQVPAALCLAALPMLTRLVPEDRARLASTVGSIVRVGLGVGLPLVVLAWIGAELLLSLIYSAPYLPAARPLRILLGTIPLMLADGAQSYLLIAAGRQRRLLGVTMLGAASNLALNLALIPPLGMEGAAIATLVSEAIVLVATQHGVRDLYGWGEFRRSLLGPFGRSGRG
jgi:O-antigen/teichoic acid export membrane protein